ncbi:MAG: hypothetical protein AAFY41_01525 [Bacteroidota bacterium]
MKLHEGSVKEILGETNVVEISSSDLHSLSSVIEQFNGLEKIERENDSLLVYLSESRSSEELNKFCFDRGISLKKLIPQSKSLEQEFLKILKEND